MLKSSTAGDGSRLDLAQIRNSALGKRCFILGNGPSLNQTNLKALSGEITIGLNRIYLKFPEMGFATNYICCVNELVCSQFSSDFSAQSMPMLLNESSSEFISPKSNIAFMHSNLTAGFSTDLSEYSWHPGATVTFCALQLAFHIGATEVILLGVDHNFVHSGRAHRAERATGPDKNHFHADYFGKNVVWQYPDLVDSELNYTVAREIFRINGRTILDGTVGGKLTIYPKITGYATDELANREIPLEKAIRAGTAATDHGAGFKLYVSMLNARKSKTIPILASLILVSSLALGLFIFMESPMTILGLLAFVLFFGALAVLVSPQLIAAFSGWARRRRMKDSEILINALSQIPAHKSERG